MKLLKKIWYYILSILYGDKIEELVKQEAKKLRKYATKEELSRLDFDLLSPFNGSLCIYGQMCGNCFNKRASQLLLKCASRAYISINPDNITDEVLNGIFTKKGRERQIHWSPIERFIAQRKQNQSENDRRLIAYLKGEIEILEFI